MTATLPPLHELQGLGAIQVDVTGVPAALGASLVSEATLRVAALDRLKQCGVPISDSPVVECPQLTITLSPVVYEGTYFVTIDTRLVEHCSLARASQPPGRSCVTWWVASPLAIVSRGSESRLEQLVLSAVDRFASAYLFDNPKASKNKKTSNQGVQPTRGAPPRSPE